MPNSLSQFSASELPAAETTGLGIDHTIDDCSAAKREKQEMRVELRLFARNPLSQKIGCEFYTTPARR